MIFFSERVLLYTRQIKILSRRAEQNKLTQIMTFYKSSILQARLDQCEWKRPWWFVAIKRVAWPRRLKHRFYGNSVMTIVWSIGSTPTLRRKMLCFNVNNLYFLSYVTLLTLIFSEQKIIGWKMSFNSILLPKLRVSNILNLYYRT